MKTTLDPCCASPEAFKRAAIAMVEAARDAYASDF